MKTTDALLLFGVFLMTAGCAANTANVSGTTSNTRRNGAAITPEVPETNFISAYPDAPRYSGDESKAADFRTRAFDYLKRLNADLRQIEEKAAHALANRGAVDDAHRRILIQDSRVLRVELVAWPNRELASGHVFYPDFPAFADWQARAGASSRRPAAEELVYPYLDAARRYLRNCGNDQRQLEAKREVFERYLNVLGEKDVRLRIFDW